MKDGGGVDLVEADVGCPTTTTKMVWRLEQQVHRLLITTIWDGGRIVLPDYNNHKGAAP
jgi:hypothetical protein